MSKKSPFFKFDVSDWLSGSIQFLGYEEKGLFIDLCAMYWQKEKPIKIDAKFKLRSSADEGQLSDLIVTLSDLELIEKNELGITVPFLNRLMDDRQQFLKNCSKGGKKSSKGKGNSSNKKEERRKKKEDFIPPSAEDVREYALSRGRLDLADNFFNYFDAGSWVDSKGSKVLSWKQKFITWENNTPKPKDPLDDPDYDIFHGCA